MLGVILMTDPVARGGVNAESCSRVQNVLSVITAHSQCRARKRDTSGITEGNGRDIW